MTFIMSGFSQYQTDSLMSVYENLRCYNVEEVLNNSITQTDSLSLLCVDIESIRIQIINSNKSNRLNKTAIDLEMSRIFADSNILKLRNFRYLTFRGDPKEYNDKFSSFKNTTFLSLQGRFRQIPACIDSFQNPLTVFVYAAKITHCRKESFENVRNLCVAGRFQNALYSFGNVEELSLYHDTRLPDINKFRRLTFLETHTPLKQAVSNKILKNNTIQHIYISDQQAINSKVLLKLLHHPTIRVIEIVFNENAEIEKEKLLHFVQIFKAEGKRISFKQILRSEQKSEKGTAINYSTQILCE